MSKSAGQISPEVKKRTLVWDTKLDAQAEELALRHRCKKGSVSELLSTLLIAFASGKPPVFPNSPTNQK